MGSRPIASRVWYRRRALEHTAWVVFFGFWPFALAALGADAWAVVASAVIAVLQAVIAGLCWYCVWLVDRVGVRR